MNSLAAQELAHRIIHSPIIHGVNNRGVNNPVALALRPEPSPQGRLKAVRGTDSAANTETGAVARLRKACRDFESVLLRILLREMDKTVPQGGLLSSSSTTMYREIANDFFAVKLAESGGTGLGDVLFRELKRALVAQMPAASASASADVRSKT